MSQDGALHSPHVPLDDGGTPSDEHLTFRSTSSNLLDSLRVIDFGWVRGCNNSMEGYTVGICIHKAILIVECQFVAFLVGDELGLRHSEIG